MDNVLLPNYLAQKHQDKSHVRQLAEQLIRRSSFKKTNQLSQGEQQRVSIAGH
jgi:putative ABC transport system ATP-binding protein